MMTRINRLEYGSHQWSYRPLHIPFVVTLLFTINYMKQTQSLSLTTPDTV